MLHVIIANIEEKTYRPCVQQEVLCCQSQVRSRAQLLERGIKSKLYKKIRKKPISHAEESCLSCPFVRVGPLDLHYSKSRYVTLCWLTNRILVLLTSEHWSRIYQSINVVLETR